MLEKRRMGGRKKLFSIPSFFKVGNKKIKVLKVGTDGLLLDAQGFQEVFASLGKLRFKGDFILPYDGYNQLVVKGIGLECKPSDDSSGVFCAFHSLTPEQERFFHILIRERVVKRLVPYLREFMNYTQDEEVRKLLIAAQKEAEVKGKLRAAAPVALLFTILLLILTPVALDFLLHRESSLTVKVIEEGGALQKSSAAAVKVDSPIEPPIPEVSVAYTQEESSPLRGKRYYCVQVVSSPKREKVVEKALEFKPFPYVRVEKLGDLYALRVGFFESEEEARRLEAELKGIGEKDAFTRVCAYKPERWVYPAE